MTRDDINSLSHSKWNCKYHVVFAPKYRRMIIYKQIKADIGKILRKLCEQKEVENDWECAAAIAMLKKLAGKKS